MYDAIAPKICLTVIYMIYVHALQLAVGQGLFCGHWSILYRFVSNGFGYQYLFYHVLPSHFVFPLPAVFCLFVFCLLDNFETLNRVLLEQPSLLMLYIREEREKIKENVLL